MKKRRWFLLGVVTLMALVSVALPAQTTDLQVTRSGNDIVLSWTTGTANFTVGASNNDPRFSQGQALATDLVAGPYTYSGAVANGVTLQFFDVSGLGDTSPLGNYTGGATPPPVPIVTSVSPTTGLKVGDILTINGTGFSLIPQSDIVHFPEGIAAAANPSPTPTATSFQVTIPRGALSGPAWVQVDNQVSGSTTLVILTQNAFARLSGVAYQPTTKDIWLSDRGLGTSLPTRIYQLSFSGTAWTKTASDIAGSGTFKYQGAQGFDSSQNWYFGFAEAEVAGGTRKKATNPPGAATTFTNVKPSSLNTIQVLGIATSPSLTDTAFFAYNDVTTGEKHIRKIASSGVLDTDYGNFGATNLGFNSLAGLVLDQAGNLFDTETTQIRKIDPAEGSSIIATGLTTAFGIALDQTNASDPGMLLVSDFSAGALVAVDLSSSPATKATIVSGLNLPRAASFAVTPLTATTCARLPNTDLSFVAIGEDTQVRQIPDPRLSITPAAPTRVWISKKRADDAYPTSTQSADHQITITATMTPAPNTQRTVCFRVVDPPDTAPYADGTTTGYWCDNRDPATANNAGKLWDTGTSTWKDVVCVQTVNGQASVALNTTDRYAGDNYIVQASFDTWNTSNTTKALAQTGIITACKRVYIEKDKMFRRGAVLVENCSACSAIRVADGHNLQNGDSIVVFDETNPAENGGETRTVSGAPNNNSDGSWTVTLDSAVTKTYSASGPPISGGIYGSRDFANGHSGGVGVPSAGYYEADLGSMWQTYNDAFVEYWVPPDGVGALPYLSPVSTFYDTGASYDAIRTMFNSIWFKNAQGVNPNNHLHLLGARGKDYIPPLLTTGISMDTNKYSYIYVRTLETGYPLPGDASMANQACTVHELGHQFRTNFCTDLPNCSGSNPATWEKHDYRGWWKYGGTGCPSSDPCLMDPGGGAPTDAVNRFCKEDLLLGDPNAPCNSGMTQKTDTAIRTVLDPIP